MKRAAGMRAAASAALIPAAIPTAFDKTAKKKKKPANASANIPLGKSSAPAFASRNSSAPMTAAENAAI